MRKSDQFDENYFKTGFGPNPYERTEPWLTFYANVVDQIIRSLKPKSVLDAGCALGMVVESFWDRGVEAKGIDISEYAISHVRPDMREHCEVASLTEPIQAEYDLIVCIEVLEHMPAEDAKTAISNFAAATDAVLFSSTPRDFDEITHVNVRPTLSWIKQFEDFGFVPDVLYDASYITPHAILFKKGEGLSDDTLTLFSEQLRLKYLIDERSQSFENKRQLLEKELSQTREKIVALEEGLLETERKNTTRHEELLRLRRQVEQSRMLIQKQKEKHQIEAVSISNEIISLQQQIAQMEGSISWRATAPLRAATGKLPSKVNTRLRQIAKAGYWAMTPHRIPARIKFIRQRNEANAENPLLSNLASQSPTGTPEIPASKSLIEEKFYNLVPLPIFRDRASEKTVTVITDSVDRNSLFGGVGTALIAGLLLAKRTGSRFRLATRTNPPDPAVLGTIMKAHKISFTGATDFAHVPLGHAKPLAVSDEDIFLTTSWWGTHATLGSISPDKIIYILQEDERMFYPHEDTRLKCCELLANPDISLLVNTEMLYLHFDSGPEPLANLSKRAVAFEPSFPAFSRPRRLERHGKKKNFFFYARPNHSRNLYWRGLEAIDGAMRRGQLSKDEWDIHFVGHNVEPMELPGGTRPIVWSRMSWSEYAKLVSRMDLGLSLMDTPHPSYPPLDLAASGAVAITNQHGVKRSLEQWSKNIITVPSDLTSLINAIETGAARAANLIERHDNCIHDHIERDWETSLGSAIDRLLDLRSL